MRAAYAESGWSFFNVMLRKLVIFLLLGLAVLPAWAITTTTTTIAASAPAPYGSQQTVTFTATVAGDDPTGMITWKDGTTILATTLVNASGMATYNWNATSIGSHSITAAYGGDQVNYNLMSTSPPLQFVVMPYATGTGISISNSPIAQNGVVTLDVNVASLQQNVAGKMVTESRSRKFGQ